MVSLVISGHRQRRWTNDRVARRGHGPSRGISHSAQPDSEEPDARRAYAPTVGRASGSGAEYDTEKAQTKGGASGGPAEERAWLRRRGMRLLKIEETEEFSDAST